jgi:hypothetical protein
MEVAIRLEVDESPLSLARQSNVSVPVFTKHILRIDSHSNEPEHDYIQETIHFSSSTIQEAERHLLTNTVHQDAILINPADLTKEAQLHTLKATAQRLAIPFILHTNIRRGSERTRIETRCR